MHAVNHCTDGRPPGNISPGNIPLEPGENFCCLLAAIGGGPFYGPLPTRYAYRLVILDQSSPVSDERLPASAVMSVRTAAYFGAFEP